MRKKINLVVSLSVSALILSACGAAATQAAPTPNAGATAEAMIATIAAQTMQALPTQTPLPTPTEAPFYVTATIWTEEPRIPIVNFHQFAPNTSKRSTDHKVRLEDFLSYMDQLNQADFTLISVANWLAGDFYVPAGKRPLVFTMDDLFYNNQIRLDENGVPLPDTGLAVAWNFAQEHPEFGFQWALFSNLGDKLYAEPTNPEKDWQTELGNAIAWCLDNNARVYNHTYQHVRLDLSEPSEIIWQLKANDQYLRELLTRVGREDLIPELGNMFAIPYGAWPGGDGGQRVIREYTNPEGVPMQAVFDIDFLVRAAYLGFPFGEDYDQYHIPRLAMPPDAIPYLAERKDEFPSPTVCQVGPLDEEQANAPPALADAINASIASGACPAGVYIIADQTFDARQDVAAPLILQ